MQPPGGLPIHAMSLIGFAQWHLSRGEPEEDVLARIAADYRFAHYDPATIDTAVGFAQINVRAQNTANAPGYKGTLAEAFGGEPQAGALVGVRVVMDLQYPDGHMEQVSLVINAGNYYTAGDVVAEAKRLVSLGQLGSRSGRAYPSEIVGEPKVILVAGGLQGPIETI